MASAPARCMPFLFPHLLLATLVLASRPAANTLPPPDIVFLLADDLGYNEMGFMNTSRGLLTPSLDKLASTGAIFRNYYVQPICSPTRSALMTGRYPLRLGTQSNVIFWDTPWSVPLNHTFLPQYLKEGPSGYHTAMFGKWHLGMHAEEYTPWSRGFDEHAGYLQGCGSGWTHVSSCCQAGPHPTKDQHFVCNATGDKDYRGYDWFSKGGVPDKSVDGTRSAEVIRSHALRFLAEQGALRRSRHFQLTEEAAASASVSLASDEPASASEASEPPRATPQTLRLASQHKPFFLYLPFQNVHGPYDVPAEYRDLFRNSTHNLTAEEQIMFGYISEMDSVVGDVHDELVRQGLYENTLIIFSSDNGAPNHENVRGRNWPFRGYKTQIYEGGVRVPAFVSGGFLPISRRGTVSDELYHVTDWLPTILAAADGTQLDGVDGKNAWPSMSQGKASPRTEVIYNINPLCESGQAGPPKAGIRVGNFKLLAYCYHVTGRSGAGSPNQSTGPTPPPGGSFPPSWPKQWGDVVLFDLSKDPSEEHDVSDGNPEVVKTLLARLKKVSDEDMVEPMQWTAPYQGKEWECADCPLRPAVNDPSEPWTPWIKNGRLIDAVS